MFIVPLEKQFSIPSNLNTNNLGGFINQYPKSGKNLDEIKEEIETGAEVEDIFD